MKIEYGLRRIIAEQVSRGYKDETSKIYCQFFDFNIG